jgi:NAD(P)H-hydrate epimerase
MPCPVVSIAQMRDWEQATWAAGQTEAEVIRRVGKCVARLALKLTQPQDLILLLAGKGHNGEDARCAREHLAGRRIDTLEVADPETALPRLETLLSLRPALIVDGLFGIGLDRPLSPQWVGLLQRVNQARTTVLAVDVPSGLNADTGEPQGAAIEAAVTLAVGAPKLGLLKEPAWPYVGRLEVAHDVGLLPCPLTSDVLWTLPGDFAAYPPRRQAATHKGTYGHLAILAGSLGFHGAAVLAARAAQRAQPGLITLYTFEAVYHACAAQLQAVMVSPWLPAGKLPASHSAVLLGPGLAAAGMADQMKLVLRNLWRDSALPLVVDASALDWLPLDPADRNALRVVTPHPGEAARLLRCSPRQIQANRLNAVREISKRFGNSWVVLKGHQTLIGRSAGQVFVNPSGNPHLAQGGSGDLLAGFIAGLLAQPPLQNDVLALLRYAVWQHGAAADCLQDTRPNWVLEDLVHELGKQTPP